jgi:DNA-binding MarR family transcriptional regulator
MASRKPPAPLALDRTLSYRLHLLHKLSDLESQRRYPLEAGLSMSDGRCLSAIGAFGALSVNALAQMSNLNKAQASRAAQSLVDQGLVSKQPSPADGRGVLLSLTPAGRKLWARTAELIARRNQEIFGCLNEPEQKSLGDLLDRLIAHARQGAPGHTD